MYAAVGPRLGGTLGAADLTRSAPPACDVDERYVCISGAHAAGWNTVWVKRDATADFDPWGVDPTATIADLRELTAVWRKAQS